MIRNAVQHSENVRNSLGLNYKSAALNQLSYAGAFTYINHPTVRMIDGLSIAQGGVNRRKNTRPSEICTGQANRIGDRLELPCGAGLQCRAQI
jgi:hypothetical protein